jgi:hypothetical protein
VATHTLLTPTIIAREALRLLKNNLVMGNLVYRAYETEFPGAPKKGGSVQIRKPNRFAVAKTRVRSTKTISESYITLTVATQAHVSWNFFSVDLTLTIEDYSERYIRPAAAALANTIDADLCGLYVDVPNAVAESTGFVSPHTFMVLGKAMQKMDEEAVPPDERVVVFNPAAHWSFANSLSNWNFKEGGEQALRKGFLGRIANCEIFMDQNIKVFLSGKGNTDVASASYNSFQMGSTTLPVSGSSLGRDYGNYSLRVQNFQFSSTAPLTTGDILAVAGVYAVNPMSGESTGALRQFVVTTPASLTHDSSGNNSDVTVYPQLLAEGPYATISAYPVSAAKVYVFGDALGKSYPQNLAFHKNAFALCMVPLEKPDGQWSDTVTEDGFSIRVVKDYDIDVDSEIIRLDVLYGVKTLYPELACRIYGKEQT